MDWFQQLRAALPAYYPPGSPPDVVGYLQGSANPMDWRRLMQNGREQMIVLSHVPPTHEDWVAAGDDHRGSSLNTPTVQLTTFITTYGRFNQPTCRHAS